MISSSVNNNHAALNGGGIQNYGRHAMLRLENCSLFDNSALFGAGLSQFVESTCTIVSCIFANNEAIYRGGALVNHAMMTINDTIFRNNSAREMGGAIELSGSGADLSMHSAKSSRTKQITVAVSPSFVECEATRPTFTAPP